MAVTETSPDGYAGKKEYFTRFTASQRIEHIILMITFIMLSLTGLAQKFYSAGWAGWLILSMGGIEYTRLVHRAFAVIFSAGILYHLASVTCAVFLHHARPTMVPTLKDARDVINVLRYSFGFIEKPPQFGKFDYRQKFEYWGIIFGSVIIITSGFALTFPLLVTKVLSGQFVAAAKEFHGNEAMLAVITIVIWHLYDVIFRPGVFPGDTSIFTGKISRERMVEEHSLEYAEIEDNPSSEGSGELPPAKVESPVADKKS